MCEYSECSVHNAKLIFTETEMIKNEAAAVFDSFAFIQVAASVSTVLLTHCSSFQPCTATHTHLYNQTHIHLHDSTKPCTEWDGCFDWDKDGAASSFTTVWLNSHLQMKSLHRLTTLYWDDEPPHKLDRNLKTNWKIRKCLQHFQRSSQLIISFNIFWLILFVGHECDMWCVTELNSRLFTHHFLERFLTDTSTSTPALCNSIFRRWTIIEMLEWTAAVMSWFWIRLTADD